jgi:phage/plasmid-associated DNA primase
MVNLKSGRLIDPLPDDNLTLESEFKFFQCSCPLGKCGMVGIKCDSKCNIGFIEKIFRTMMNDDEELYNHLRWVIGYCLTGDPKKKLAFFGYGEKYNGKSLVSNAIIDIMPMYARAMDKAVVIKAKMAKQAGGTSEHLVHLNGIRMAILNETSENDAVDEEQIKCITGRDKKNVRGIYGKAFDMDMEFAPFVCTNFKPKISLSDPAMWERVCPLLFPVSFLRDPEPNNPNHRKIDEDLGRKLKMHSNMERMYNWLIRCSLYYTQNQDKPFPNVIKEEITKYRMECNVIIEFIEENKGVYSIDINAETDWQEFKKQLEKWCQKRGSSTPHYKKLIAMLKQTNCEVKTNNNTLRGLKKIQPIQPLLINSNPTNFNNYM